jgi:hypothetical protein
LPKFLVLLFRENGEQPLELSVEPIAVLLFDEIVVPPSAALFVCRFGARLCLCRRPGYG